MKRTRLRLQGARKKRELRELQHFRTEIYKRAGYACERCGSTRDLHPHHRVPKSRGGSNDPENGHCLCSWCHRLIHDHAVPDWRTWIG
jgi:5-methylcytosine-specific restriction endonuclease McrA